MWLSLCGVAETDKAHKGTVRKTKKGDYNDG